MVRDYENWNNDQPYNHAIYYTAYHLDRYRHHPIKQREAAESICCV